MTQIAAFDGIRSAPAGARQQRVHLRTAASAGHASALHDSLTICTDWEGLQVHREDWFDLARRALEPNVFADPLFLTASLQHIAAAQRPVFVLTWRINHESGARQLTGVFPLHIPGRILGAGIRAIARLWFSPMMANSAPLIDADQPAHTLRQLGAWMAARHPHIKGIVFPALATDGPTMRALTGTTSADRLPVHLFDHRFRAMAARAAWQTGDKKATPSASTAKELRRLRRRLGEDGELTYVSAQTPNTLRPAMEQFLALEAAGWKGKRGTALVCDPSTATFARALIRHFARRGRCRIDALTLDGKPIAMGIALKSDDRVYYWKTCFDESYARFSPGSLFSLELTDAIFEDASVSVIDSCAIENHPMIDRLWRERMGIADVCLGMPQTSVSSFQTHMKIEETRRTMRRKIKSAFNTLSRRRAS